MKKFLVLITAMILVGLLCQAQTVDEIIAKNMEVKGGIDKLRALKTNKITGKMSMTGFETTVTMWYKEPDMMKMEMSLADKVITLAFDGKTAWQISPMTGSEDPQEMTGPQAEMIKDNTDMMSDPLVDYKKKGFKLDLEGKEDMEGTPVYKLKLTKKNGKITYFFIDAENYIELKTQSTRTVNEQEITTETFYGDFKEIDGLMMPHSLSIKTNGQDMGNIVLETVELNTPLEDNFFKMPPKKAAPPVEPEKK